MKTVHVRIPDEHLDALEKLAEDEDRDLSWVIRRAVRNFLENEPATSQDAPQRAVTQRVLGVAANP